MCQFRVSWQNSLLLRYVTIQRRTQVSIVSVNHSSSTADSLAQIHVFVEMIKQNECGEICM